MYVCICNRISDQQITDLVGRGEVDSYEELQEQTGVGDCCGKCDNFARDCVKEAMDLRPKPGQQFSTATGFAAQRCEA